MTIRIKLTHDPSTKILAPLNAMWYELNMARPQRRYTEDDYFTIEEMSEIRHEYHQGEIFAMAGASAAHNAITINVVTRLQTALRRHGCRAYGSDLRIQTPSGLYTYPDISVVCGPLLFVPGRDDTVTNPTLLVEVASDATREYDRGDKFGFYKSIPTFREYLLIEQALVHVQQWSKNDRGRWVSSTQTQLGSRMQLASLPLALRLSEIYRDVFGDNATTRRRAG